MTYTVEDLDAAVEEAFDDWHDFIDATEQTKEYLEVPAGTEGGYERQYGELKGKWVAPFDLEVPGALLDLGEVVAQAVTVDRFGGEGQGDDYWAVFKVTVDEVDRYFKRNGYHVSHDGSYFDGPTEEVRSVEKTITVWE
jgi:hypothetical protein